jgi:hypothetical protein
VRERLTEKERLHSAFGSGDLSLRAGRRGDADHLIALGLAARQVGGPADALIRVHLASSTTDLRAALRSTLSVAKRLAQARGWKVNGRNLVRVAELALAHHIYPTCLHCSGRGFEKAPNAPVLTTKRCTHCDGTGRRPIQKRWRPEIAELISVLERIDSVTQAAVVRRLR